jgi:hypothetical protein
MPPLDVCEKYAATNGDSMTLAALKMKGQDWDDVKIAVGGEHPAIVVLKDRTSVADLNTTLLHALFDNEDAPLTLTIDGKVHTLEAPVWVELLDKTAEWMEKYLPAMDPDYLKSEIDLKTWNKIDRTDPGSDTSAQVIEFSHFQ